MPRADPGLPRRRARAPPPRQAQARLYPARRYRRLPGGGQRREDHDRQKLADKQYHRFTGYIGNPKTETWRRRWSAIPSACRDRGQAACCRRTRWPRHVPQAQGVRGLNHPHAAQQPNGYLSYGLSRKTTAQSVAVPTGTLVQGQQHHHQRASAGRVFRLRDRAHDRAPAASSLTKSTDKFDDQVTRPAAAPRQGRRDPLGIARALVEYDELLKIGSQGQVQTRDARSRAQEGRSHRARRATSSPSASGPP